jgi:hypothetical protein
MNCIYLQAVENRALMYVYRNFETVEVVFFFVTGLETLQVLGVEMSTGGSTESNVRSFEAFLTIYLSIIITHLIITLFLLKKNSKKRINAMIRFLYLTGATVV